ncbi:TPR repeat-containing protein YrrB [Phycisphaerae bacterium RAS2]|nr:TPR repeat-containing protein YrrB [Phycisphaerae bacterium RAS2]
MPQSRQPDESACDAAPRWVWVAAGLIAVATLAAYLPAMQGGFIWDDDAHVTAPELRSTGGLLRIWFDIGATQQYYPLLHSAFWIQHKLWGDWPVGYHIVNALLHALSAVLVLFIVRRLLHTAQTPWANPTAALAAAVFALHPVHVESVAWITELKNTLSGVFYLSAMALYLRFDESRRAKWHAFALMLFVCGLLTKTVTATLPAALLVILWWLRGRLTLRRDVAPLLIWFALGAAAGLFTAWVEHDLIGAKGEEFELSAMQRGLLAGRVVWFYLGKLFWPANLVFIYPRWDVNPSAPSQWLFSVALIVLVAALFLLRRRSRAPLAALLFFIGTLFPVLGFFNVYPFLFSFVADHFQYLASLGIIVFICAAIMRSVPARASRFAFALPFVIPLALAMLTFRQCGLYADGQTLYRTTIDRNPACWMAHNNLGVEYKNAGRIDDALACYRRALALRPNYPEAWNNIGLALTELGDPRGAADAYQQALKLRPANPGVLSNLGTLLTRVGRHADAIARHEAALRLDPNDPQLHGNLGVSLQAAGRYADAVSHYHRSLESNPDQPGVRLQISLCEAAMKPPPQAIAAYAEIIRANPDNSQAYFARAVLLAQTGRRDDAISDYRRALEINPDHFEAHNNLATLLALAGRHTEAIPHFEQAVRLRPDFVEIRMNLAVAYAAVRQADRAREAAQIALDQARANGRIELVKKIEDWIRANSAAPKP